MNFERQPTDAWRNAIPGARWFKADLHVHTIDDHAGGKASMPDGFTGDPRDSQFLSRYARCFLQGVVASGVQVVGLTPHSTRAGDGPETSAVWKIVEEWNQGHDDDGVPFREKVFAVFPGFEPSLNNGSEGLHLLFLFDPEIGQQSYQALFDVVMGGVPPWDDVTLQMSAKAAEDAFMEIGRFHRQNRTNWHHIVLAPHIEAPKGLFVAQKAQVLKLFSHSELAGLELGDEKLPEDTLRKRPWLLDGMRAYHHAFFHGSDAYSIEEIGRRHTWMKLASPRIEALRQAFVASDSRMRIGFVRDAQGSLTAIPDTPDVTINQRPWLKSVTVRGGSSFFGLRDAAGEPRETRLELSPDLTCMIGSSMTGKSTFLDGLRMHIGAPLPDDDTIKAQVRSRAENRFLLGSSRIVLDTPGSDPTASDHDQWPAIFFAQGELKRLADAGSIEQLLARLVPAETSKIEERSATLKELDDQLSSAARSLVKLDEALAEAEEDHARSMRAKEELDAFEGAGVNKLLALGRQLQNWKGASQEGSEVESSITAVLSSARSLTTPEINDELRGILINSGIDLTESAADARLLCIVKDLESALFEIKGWINTVILTSENLNDHESAVRIEVERTLEDQGLEPSRLVEFQKLSQQAALLASYEANHHETTARVKQAERSMEFMRKQRRDLVEEQRQAFDRVLAHITEQFGGRIRARRIKNGGFQPLNDFLAKMAQTGVTRWWNGLKQHEKPSPESLLDCLERDTLTNVDMTPAVQQSFREAMTKSRCRSLAALRASDTYVLEMHLDDGSYRQLDLLSGGQRVNILLSLLLETADNRPLVIDQPEDEIDNRFLWETILPALKKLKGRRQIIVATHNPNIVVNGDADMVIRLEATANRGWIAESGAIEEPSVRDAIVRTVDGGDEAFRLRQQKYGF